MNNMNPMANRVASTSVIRFVRRSERDMAIVEVHDSAMGHLAAILCRGGRFRSTTFFWLSRSAKVVEVEEGRQSVTR